MNKFVMGSIITLGLVAGLTGPTTAQAKTAKWTKGTPQPIRGAWYAKPRVRHFGSDTEVTNNALILTPRWLYVMYDYGTHDYGGNRLVYRYTGKQYRLRSYDSLEKTWSYTKVQRRGKTLHLQKYGTRHRGKAFKAHAGKTYHLHFNSKMSAKLSAK